MAKAYNQAADGQTAPAQGVVVLPIERVLPGAGQARTRFDEPSLRELAASIAVSGVIQPVVVAGDHQHGYRLLAGERRWRAAQRAGLADLPAIVRNDLADREAAVLGLIENLQRESLSIMDTARGLARLCTQHGLTHDEAARRIGKSRVYVTNTLRLCRLAEPVQQLLDDGELEPGHGKILAGMAEVGQIRLARQAAAAGWSVRRLERALREPASARPAAASAGDDSHMAELQARLSEHVGNPVIIDFDAQRRRGELRIRFHDLDEFDGLLARLGYIIE